jgi:hypothetical protein
VNPGSYIVFSTRLKITSIAEKCNTFFEILTIDIDFGQFHLFSWYANPYEKVDAILIQTKIKSDYFYT